ncbi:MAG: DNA-3-methyladenine glycosylase I [Rhodocyclaceae bacterium]
MQRCPWCGTDPLYVAYHDTEWGVPCHDERRLFEFLLLEGMQAGLSWLTILKKRENFRRAFDGFDVEKIARYGERDIARLLGDPSIVRNRLKILAAIANSRATRALYDAGSSLDELLWKYVEGRPVINRWRTPDEVPVSTPAAAALSKELIRRGFRFVGPTIVYALMQATGMVNDHLVTCPRHAELTSLAESFERHGAK